MRTKEEIMEEVMAATDHQTSALVEVLVDTRDQLVEMKNLLANLKWHTKYSSDKYRG